MVCQTCGMANTGGVTAYSLQKPDHQHGHGCCVQCLVYCSLVKIRGAYLLLMKPARGSNPVPVPGADVRGVNDDAPL